METRDHIFQDLYLFGSAEYETRPMINYIFSQFKEILLELFEYEKVGCQVSLALQIQISHTYKRGMR